MTLIKVNNINSRFLKETDDFYDLDSRAIVSNFKVYSQVKYDEDIARERYLLIIEKNDGFKYPLSLKML